MGLFSSKYVTHVATSTSRVVEDHSLPDSVKHGAIKGLFDGGDQFIENIMEDLVSSIGIKAERMFNYGKTKYAYGLPSSSILMSDSGKTLVQSTIAAEVGQAVTLIYYNFGAFNNMHVGWVKLIAEHGYNPATNQLGVLTAAKGKPVKLSKMTVVVSEASLLELNNGSLAQWDNVAKPAPTYGPGDAQFISLLRKVNEEKKPDELFQLDPASDHDYLRVDYYWQEDYTAVVEGVNVTRTRTNNETFNIPILGFDEHASWHQAKYTKANGQIGYWMYKEGAGTHPEIDNLHVTTATPAGSYYPWGYFRFDKVSGTADKSSDWYKQSKKMMDYIGLDYEAVTNAIHQNPDIEQVEQAMLMMAVPANTTNQIELRYLYDYFSQMLDLTGGTLQENKPYQSNGSISEFIMNIADPSLADASIVIQDQRFKMALGFRYISHKIVQGSIGKVGIYNSEIGDDLITETGSNTQGGSPISWNTRVKFHTYRKQTTPTQYEEVRVTNLKMIYHIYGIYTDTGDGVEDILLIPLDRSITRNYMISDRELLYARSMHYVFNSRVITEIKWYQQEWFSTLLLVAAIVLTILSIGETWETISLALAAGEITIDAIIYMIVIGVIKYIAISIAVRLFIKAVGVEFALFVAILALVSGSYQAIESGSIQGAPWAAELLQISTGLTKGINMELAREFKELKQEADDFSLFVKDEQAKLEEANKLLENSNVYTPLVIFGEKPDDYFHRTVHSGNIGVLSLDAISSFTEIRLQLPKLIDTL